MKLKSKTTMNLVAIALVAFSAVASAQTNPTEKVQPNQKKNPDGSISTITGPVEGCRAGLRWSAQRKQLWCSDDPVTPPPGGESGNIGAPLVGYCVAGSDATYLGMYVGNINLAWGKYVNIMPNSGRIPGDQCGGTGHLQSNGTFLCYMNPVDCGYQ